MVQFIISIDYINQIIKTFLESWYKTLKKDRRHLSYILDNISIYFLADIYL